MCMLNVHVLVKENAISEDLAAESALLLDSMMLAPCQLLLTKSCIQSNPHQLNVCRAQSTHLTLLCMLCAIVALCKAASPVSFRKERAVRCNIEMCYWQHWHHILRGALCRLVCMLQINQHACCLPDQGPVVWLDCAHGHIPPQFVWP